MSVYSVRSGRRTLVDYDKPDTRCGRESLRPRFLRIDDHFQESLATDGTDKRLIVGDHEQHSFVIAAIRTSSFSGMSMPTLPRIQQEHQPRKAAHLATAMRNPCSVDNHPHTSHARLDQQEPGSDALSLSGQSVVHRHIFVTASLKAAGLQDRRFYKSDRKTQKPSAHRL